MKQKRIKDVKRGEFFRLRESDTAPVWVRDEYNRSTRKYEGYRYDNTGDFAEFNGTRVVFVDFEF